MDDEMPNSEMPKKYNDRSSFKGWFLTYPKCPVKKEDALTILETNGLPKIVEYVIAEEEHKDGTPHLHAFIKLEKKRRFKDVATKFDLLEYHGHYEPAKSWKAVSNYCKKEGNYIANIDIESAKQKKSKKNSMLLTKNPKELIDEGEISLLQLKSLLENKRLYKMLDEVPKIIPRKCFWIYGEPRVGKSYCVRMAFDVFEKPMNKWWDGYCGEEVVLIDDFDKHGQCLGHYMKIWADNYRFTAEIKGGTIIPTYKKFIVTSNYQIGDIFEDEEVKKAIVSRFICLKLYNRDGQKIIIEELNK